jgi:hypothetical protein
VTLFALLQISTFAILLCKKNSSKEVLLSVKRIQLKPSLHKAHRKPAVMNGALPLKARSSNMLGDDSIHENVINLVSDEEDNLVNLGHAIIGLDSSNGKRKGRRKPRIKAEPSQPNGFQGDNLYNASPLPANVVAQIPDMNVARHDVGIPTFQREWGGDFIHDDAFDDAELAKVMMEEISADPRIPTLPQGRIALPGPDLVRANEVEEEPIDLSIDDDGVESRTNVIVTLLSVFPDICQDYVSELYDTVSPSSDQLVAHILDQTEKGKHYPKSKDKQRNLKRKRDFDEDATAALKYGAADRAPPPVFGQTRMTT